MPVIGQGLARSLLTSFAEVGDAAARIAQVVAARSGGRVHARDFLNVPTNTIERVASDFCRRGWLSQNATGWNVPTQAASNAMPEGVVAFLQGASAMHAAMDDEALAVAAVTMPTPPSALAAALPATGLAHTNLVPTADAMNRVADDAVERLTVMTPFVNEEGLNYAIGLFRRSQAKRRNLIVRPTQATRTHLKTVRSKIDEARIDVRGYLLPSLRGNGYETFHAKIVLADSDVAYVGSANMLSYARGSAELGVIIRGREARIIASVVRAVEAISSKVEIT